MMKSAESFSERRKKQCWSATQRRSTATTSHNSRSGTFKMRKSILAGACMTAISSAARFTLHIPTSQLFNPSTLLSSTHATLQSSGPPIDAHLTRSNSFNFNNVSAGSYLATIHSRDYIFEPLRIDVSVEEAVEGSGDKKEVIRTWQTFLGNEWDNKGESRGEGGNGLVVEARLLGPKHFYQERSGCECNINDASYIHGHNH